MSTQLALLVPSTFLAAADAVLYTAPVTANGVVATTAKITRAVFVNTTGGALTVTAGITTGGALSAATELVVVSIPANQTFVSPELQGQVVPSGSQIRAFTSAGTSVLVAISGLTVQ